MISLYFICEKNLGYLIYHLLQDKGWPNPHKTFARLYLSLFEHSSEFFELFGSIRKKDTEKE